MAKYRAIQTKFWTDSWIMDLTPDQKYFYLYLLTNSNLTQCGIFEISFRKIEYETCFNKDKICNMLELLERDKKIKFSSTTSEVCIVNFSKYNYTLSPQVKKCIIKEFADVKDKELIPYVYGINTIYKDYLENNHRVFIDSGEKEKINSNKKNEEKEDINQNVLDIEIDLINDILSFFGFDIIINPDKKAELTEFLIDLGAKNQLDLFRTQFNAYKKYKSEVDEKLHGFSNFLGSRDKKFLNGGWNSENWKFKYENLKKINAAKGKNNNRYNSGDKDHEQNL